MEIYSLTTRGRALSHSIRSPKTPEWLIIHFLARQGKATNEQIMDYVPGATNMTLARLKSRGVIKDESGVVI